MAHGISGTDNTDGPNSDYPYGKVRDKSGSTPGTPANTKTLGDFHQFFARLLDQAGIVANGLPDNNYSGFQYYDALLKLFVRNLSPSTNLITKVIEIGDWNMNTTTSKSVTHSLGVGIYKKIRSLSVIIRDDSDSGYHNLCKASNSDGLSQGSVDIATAAIGVSRFTGGDFDDASFSSTGYNRGWITIVYEA